MDNLRQKPIWLAIDKYGRIHATWYRGCVQPFKKWRKARGDVREKRGNPQKTRKKKVEDSENEKGNEV